jgi:hypothetical protein
MQMASMRTLLMGCGTVRIAGVQRILRWAGGRDHSATSRSVAHVVRVSAVSFDVSFIDETHDVCHCQANSGIDTAGHSPSNTTLMPNSISTSNERPKWSRRWQRKRGVLQLCVRKTPLRQRRGIMSPTLPVGRARSGSRYPHGPQFHPRHLMSERFPPSPRPQADRSHHLLRGSEGSMVLLHTTIILRQIRALLRHRLTGNQVTRHSLLLNPLRRQVQPDLQ